MCSNSAQDRTELILQKGLHLLSLLCAFWPLPTSSSIEAKFLKLCMISGSSCPQQFGWPHQGSPWLFSPPFRSSSLLPAFLLTLLEMPSESSFSNRISRICPSLPETGVQKPQEWSFVLFLLSTWQFFSNMHSDMGEGSEWAVRLVSHCYVSMNLLLGPFCLRESVLNLLCLGKSHRSCE